MTGTTAAAFVPQREAKTLRSERLLRATAVTFAVALVVHGADHLRRGIDVMTTEVFVAGSVQFLMGLVAVTLVFRRHRLAPVAAVAVGFPSAVGFTAAHLLPHWSAFSDPFTGSQSAPGVTAFSWFTALFEITADLAFGLVGVQLLRAREPERL